jgi:hypothetical protein
MAEIDYEALIARREGRTDIELWRQFARFEEIAKNIQSIRRFVEAEDAEAETPPLRAQNDVVSDVSHAALGDGGF